MESLLTSPHHVIHHVWSESVSKLVKKGASSVRSPFLAPLQHAPSGLPVLGLQAKQAISHPNSRCSPRTKRGYPALCNLQPDDPYQCTRGLHDTLVLQTPQGLHVAFPVKPKYLPLIFKAFYNETLKLTFSHLFRQLSFFSCSRHPWFSAPFSASLRNI